MMRNILLIPTIEPLDLVEGCISSFYPSLVETSTLATVTYNGPSSVVLSDLSDSNVAKIGFEDSQRLVERFAAIADCPEELLFGRQKYGRSYGGASNLLLALGHALGGSVMGKVDDDCRESESRLAPWLCKAVELARADKICFGPYFGQPSGFLHELPEETALGFVKYVYSQKARLQRCGLGTGKGGKSVKNGNLVIPKTAPRIASYPVLYEPTTNTHARGEVYYWLSELRQEGFTFTYQQSLQIRHDPSSRNNLNSWLRSLVLAFDLSLVHRTYLREGRQPTLLERRTTISRFKSWLLSAKWPETVVAEELTVLLDEVALDFTERFYSELPRRRLAWKRLMSADLDRVIEEVIPELKAKVI